MDTTDAGTPGVDAPAPPAPPPPGAEPRRLTRSRTDRHLGGVCGGLATYVGVDVVVIRVIAAMSILSGIGIPAYLLAWILIPEEGPGGTTARDPRDAPRLDVLLALVVGLAVVHLLASPWDGQGMDLDLFPGILLVIGLVWWFRRKGDQSAPPPVPQSSSSGSGHAATDVGTPASPAPPAPRDPRAGLVSRLTFSGVVLTAGVFALAGASGIEVDATAALATCLLVASIGMLATAWYGKRRGLTALCVVLGIATLVSGVSDGIHVSGGGGDRTWAPTGIADLRNSYSFGAGEAALDLSSIDGVRGTRRIEVRLGVGELRIKLPPDMAAEVRGRAGAGDVRVLGRHDEGIDVEVAGTVDGDAAGRLVIDARVGLGALEVTR